MSTPIQRLAASAGPAVKEQLRLRQSVARAHLSQRIEWFALVRLPQPFDA